METNLTDDQKMIRELISDYSEKEIKPEASENERNSRFPSELIAKLGELGFMGHFVPTEYGGSGLDYLSYIIAVEEISKACASTGIIVSAHNSLACSPIVYFGTEQQKQKYLTDLASGTKLGCFALSEPEAGSDATSIKTTAVKKEKHYIINGLKSWITNGSEADVAIVFASTDKDKGSRGISAFIVDLDSEGIEIGKSEHKLGIKASSTTQIIFDDCIVPAENLLGEEGEGFKIAMKTLDGGRIGVAAQAVGIARAALEASIIYSKQRKAFNDTISNFQGIQFMLADMSTKVEAARLLTWQAASLLDQGEKFTKQSAMAKLFAAETAMWVTTKAIQIHGGNGYTTDFPVERYFRDAKVTEIYEGTSEIQKIVIARQALNEY
ncbi:MAG TPA: acyl-CoA dehydrogenase [Thermodesulfobacteriota bacterium]|nr:acyl-CoA dehydrogenase [Thermodesulfobacteriota bacterium]